MSVRNAAISLLLLIIFGFMLIHFYYFGGVPFFKDANETFQTFIHAQNMYLRNPWENSFLTDGSFRSDPADHPFTYTHNPNLPRYFSYLLLVLGIGTIKWHNIILSLAATAGSILFIYKIFKDKTPALLIVLSFFVLDFFGVLQWTTQMYRVWHFFLFFGCLLAVKKSTPSIFTFIIFFLLFQLEFSFAAFTSTTCFLVVILDKFFKVDLQSLRNIAFAICGSLASIALFVFQLITFYGWKSFLTDLQYTYLIRNTDRINFASDPEVQSFYEKHHIVSNLYSTPIEFTNFYQAIFDLMNHFYAPEVVLMLKAGFCLLIISTLFLIVKRSWFSTTKDYGAFTLIIYSWSLILGIVVMSVINRGYTYNAYVTHFFPMLVFPLIISLAIVPITIGLGSKVLFQNLFPDHFQEKHAFLFMALIAAVMLVPWVKSSLKSYRYDWPPLSSEHAKLLSTKYSGKKFITGTGHVYMITIYTGVDPIVSSIVITPEKWLATLPVAEYYICQKNPAIAVNCEKEFVKMKELGHKIVERGEDFFIAERPNPAQR